MCLSCMQVPVHTLASNTYKRAVYNRRMHSIEEQLKEHKLSTLDSTKFSVVANVSEACRSGAGATTGCSPSQLAVL